MLKKIIVLLLIGIVYFGASYLLQPKLREVLRAPQVPAQKTSTESAAPQNQATEPGKAVVDAGIVSYKCQGDESAFDGLFKETGGRVETKDYSFGKMINSINGVRGGVDNKYWIYFVDGKSASISADNYKCKNQENIEWKLLEQK